MSNPSNYKLAHQRIKRLWNEGNTEIGYHAQQRMKQRKLDMNDITNCIRYGRIIEHTKPMTLLALYHPWEGVDGKTMKCVVEINGNLIVVTVI